MTKAGILLMSVTAFSVVSAGGVNVYVSVDGKACARGSKSVETGRIVTRDSSRRASSR